MKKWQKNLIALLAGLGFTEKVKAGSLTADEQKILGAKYEETYGVSLDADKNLNEDVVVEQTLLSADQITELATLLNVNPTEAPTTQAQAVKVLATTVQTQQNQIRTLSDAPEVETVGHVQMSATPSRVLATTLGQTPHTAGFLFGIEAPMFARGKWYNELLISRTSQTSHLNDDDKQAFVSDFKVFATSVRNRVTALAESNVLGSLNFKQMIAGESQMDYSALESNPLTPEYSVRRTDLILAFIRSLPSVSDIFPVVSNIQNKEIAPTANFGELSQGYRAGEVFKGNVKFSAEIYSVTDLMFKFKFTDMIKLEKMYIGYLNREGSNPIKWTFMEWILVYFGQILVNEQNRRRVCGVRVPQQNVVSNPANLAADGVLRAIERVEEDLKILPFEDLGVYDHTSILDIIERMWDTASEIMPTMDMCKVYANRRHKQWYVRAYRAKYALNEDFTGSNGTSMTDLSPEAIVWVPNMPINCFKVWITVPGNIENYEDKPMEMLSFYFQQWLEEMMTTSRWKEGSGVLRAGIQFKTKAELMADDHINQWIFTNFPASDLALAGSVSFKENTLFEITGVTPVTAVTGFAHDFIYKLVATASFATTKLVKSGAFSTISADFQPAAAGDYIKVYAELHDVVTTVEGETVTVTEPTGNFLELERKVTV